jgi:Flp pilus assembly secretin CpaC
MSARLSRSVARFALVFAIASLASLLGAAVASSAEDTSPIAVVVDHATLVRLPDKVATLVVGNPLIADVSLQPGGAMVVTGKSYGATNVMALDHSGALLIDRMVQVEGPTDRLVTVFRGVNRETYSCTPICQRRITLGDNPDYFKSALDESGTLATQAAGGPADNKQQ